MDFKKVKSIANTISKEGNIEFDYKEEDGSLEISTTVIVDNIEMYISYDVYASKNVIYTIVFDEIKFNLQTLKLINEFNQTNWLFKAHVSENNFLVLKYSALNLQVEEDIFSIFDFLFEKLFDDNNIESLNNLLIQKL